MAKTSPNLVWIDMEMTGLDPDTCAVLEIATIITDPQLKVLAEGPAIAVRQNEDALRMDKWNWSHHTKSGLLTRVRNSPYNLATAEEITLSFIKGYTENGKNPICGNSIGQDRRFLIKYMPKIDAWLNYRSIDVSSIKELAYRWYPKLPKFQKKEVHRAQDDIRESIEELVYYRNKIFVKDLLM
ncbi:MAG: oligoribonuclease [Fibromonadaceae bacterium]|jgi:oligoribonuclease|nr:oligoribonuclease [Fibromonadaceae bacterium]